MIGAGGELCLFLAQAQSWLPSFEQPHASPWLSQSCMCFFRLGLAAHVHSWTCGYWEQVLERKPVPLGRCVALLPGDLL